MAGVESLARQPGELTRERALALTAAGQALTESDPLRAAIYFQERKRFQPAARVWETGLKEIEAGRARAEGGPDGAPMPELKRVYRRYEGE